MLPFATRSIPTTAEEWREAITDTLTRWIAGPVRLEVAGDPPDLATVDIDVSGGRLSDAAAPDAVVNGASDPGPTIGRFRAHGAPLIVRRIPIYFDVSADRARFSLGRNAAGQVVAALTHAAGGQATIRLARPDVDAALLQAAQAGAAPHGVEITAVQSKFTAAGPRDLDVTLDLSGKKFVKFTVRVTGRLPVDDTMTAAATNLKVDGSGMAAGVAATIVRFQLGKLEGKRVPLMQFGVGALRLCDVSVDPTDGLTIHASFGGE